MHYNNIIDCKKIYFFKQWFYRYTLYIIIIICCTPETASAYIERLAIGIGTTQIRAHVRWMI